MADSRTVGNRPLAHELVDQVDLVGSGQVAAVTTTTLPMLETQLIAVAIILVVVLDSAASSLVSSPRLLRS